MSRNPRQPIKPPEKPSPAYLEAFREGVQAFKDGKSWRECPGRPCCEGGDIDKRTGWNAGWEQAKEDASTIVVFRWLPSDDGGKTKGECVAVFPSVAGTRDPNTCTIYAHNGQHSTANLDGLMAMSRPATPSESDPLEEELRRIGYILIVKQRIPGESGGERTKQCGLLSLSTIDNP
jgi:ribosome modulation factor